MFNGYGYPGCCYQGFGYAGYGGCGFGGGFGGGWAIIIVIFILFIFCCPGFFSPRQCR